MALTERLRKAATCVGFLDGAPEPAADLAATLIQAADEIDRLRAKHIQFVELIDNQLGTPCEQIRHEQEVENLKAEIERLRAIILDARQVLEHYNLPEHAFHYSRVLNKEVPLNVEPETP